MLRTALVAVLAAAALAGVAQAAPPKTPIGGVICGNCGDGGGGACWSTGWDRIDNTSTGSYGITGGVSWCSAYGQVYNVSITGYEHHRGWYSPDSGMSSWGAGAACGGGAAVHFQQGFEWTFLNLGYHFQWGATVSACPGGIVAVNP